MKLNSSGFCKKVSGSQNGTAWGCCLYFSFASRYLEDAVLFCVPFWFVLWFIFFLTYETDITQSMTLLILILDHLKDFRDRAISVGVETESRDIFSWKGWDKQPLPTLDIPLKRGSLGPYCGAKQVSRARLTRHAIQTWAARQHTYVDGSPITCPGDCPPQLLAKVWFRRWVAGSHCPRLLSYGGHVSMLQFRHLTLLGLLWSFRSHGL